MKKLKYSRFFVKKFIPSLIIALCICSVSYLVYIKITEMRTKQYTDHMITTAQLYLKSYTANYGMNEESYRMALTAASNYISPYSDLGFDVAAALVDNNNERKVIATSRVSSMMVYREENSDKNNMIMCATDELLDVYNRAIELDGSIYIKNFYKDGTKFYPGEVDIIYGDYYFYSIPKEKADVYESYDFTRDIYSNYEYHDNETILLTWGSPRNSDALKYLEEHILNRNKEYKLDNAMSQNTSIRIDDKSYKLYVTCVPFFFYSGGSIVFLICGVVLLITLIYATSSSIRAYRKYCTQYEIDEYRRNMTSALAHDLKTPLTAIMGYSENLKSNVHSEKRDYYADAVIENVRYMNEIITGTLELAKIEEQDSKLNKTDTDMIALANELLAKYKADFEGRGIAVSVSGKCTVKADRELISRAVENLITNAVKYTSDGGKVEITANEKQLAICNSCDEKLTGKTEDFCKAFGKADASRSDRKGSGMGLAIVKNITLIHKFRLEASASDGKFTAKIILK